MRLETTVFTHVRGQRLSERVEDQIKEAIYSGRIQFGDRLPADRELARLFGVSRPVVREALRSLEQAGLLTIKPGVAGGAFLTPVTKKPIVDSLNLMIRTGQITLEDILQSRLLIEPQVAAQAARMVTAEDVRILDESQRRLEEGFSTEDILLEHNPRPNLHRVIAQITRNHLLIIIMDVLMSKAIQRLSQIKLNAETKQVIALDHKQIIEAIKGRDPDAASAHMQKHIQNVYDTHKALEAQAAAPESVIPR
jgi:DNA-binding FadR family transcriptional regulator